MNEISLTKINQLNESELRNLVGGYNANKVCGCVCVGPLEPGLNSKSIDNANCDCADTGASNAHRAKNEEIC